jgi:hypothetical protein
MVAGCCRLLDRWGLRCGILAVLQCVSVAAAGCVSRMPPPVATIAGKNVSLADLESRTSALPASEPERSIVLRAALDVLIDEELLLHEARRLDIKLDHEELRAICAGARNVDCRKIERRLIAERVLDARVPSAVDPSPEDIAFAYERLRAHGYGSSDVRVLVVPIPTGASPATVARLRAQAESVAERARQGDDFCRLIANFGSASAGAGSCGFIAQPKQLHKDLGDALVGLKAGAIYGPIEISGAVSGFAVAKVVRPEMSFEEGRTAASRAARAEAHARAKSEWLASWRRTQRVAVNTQAFPFLETCVDGSRATPRACAAKMCR